MNHVLDGILTGAVVALACFGIGAGVGSIVILLKRDRRND